MIDKPLPTVGPKIVQISALPMPVAGPMGPTMVIVTIGLSDDSKIYQWNGKSQKWVPA